MGHGPRSSHCPAYKARWFKSAGAAQILLYSFTAFLSITHLSYDKDIILYYGALILLVCPAMGWLADVRYGRYKFVSVSLRLLWVVTIAHNLELVAVELLGTYSGCHALKSVLAVGKALPIAGVISNALQLGIDQLPHAASTQDIVSFISWYSWSMFLAGGVYAFTQRCVCYSFSLSYLLLPLVCTLSVFLDMTMNHRLIKEPAASNPLRLIHQVVRYASKHKHPRLRSAFTYWEDKPYSRMDLGKDKYGGPFSTEQVEDVKTFFKILAVIASLLPLCFLVTITCIVVNDYLMFHYRDEKFVRSCPDASTSSSSNPDSFSSASSDFYASCFRRTNVQFLNMTVMVFVIPLVELIFPLFRNWKYFANADMLHWLCAGAGILVAVSISFLSLELVGVQSFGERNVTCLFAANEDTVQRSLTLSIDVIFLTLPQVLLGLAMYLLFTNVATFITAQAPYAMRGMVLGICYIVLGVSTGLSKITLMLASTSSSSYCGVWYHGLMVPLTVGALCGVGVVKRCYKPRRRDEDVHNQQIFAVEYYEKYLPRPDACDNSQEELVSD